MENEITAHRGGKIAEIKVAEGASVNSATSSPSSRQHPVSRRKLPVMEQRVGMLGTA